MLRHRVLWVKRARGSGVPWRALLHDVHAVEDVVPAELKWGGIGQSRILLRAAAT